MPFFSKHFIHLRAHPFISEKKNKQFCLIKFVQTMNAFKQLDTIHTCTYVPTLGCFQKKNKIKDFSTLTLSKVTV